MRLAFGSVIAAALATFLPAVALAQSAPPKTADEIASELERELEAQMAADQAAEAQKAKAQPAPVEATGEPDPSAAPPPAAEDLAPIDTATTSTTAVPFIKGTLLHVGTRLLVSRFSHVGVRLGPNIIDKDFFVSVTPGGAYYGEEWAFSFHVPLNLLAVRNGDFDEFGGLKIRRQDWDDISDYARVIRFITYGRKESQLYFTITNLRPTTLGHGQLINRYQPNIDVDRSMTGLVFDWYGDWAGFQAQLNDITFQNNVIGALAFLKPLAFLDNPVLRSLSLGVEYAADLRAPLCVVDSSFHKTSQVDEIERRLDADEFKCLKGTGHDSTPNPLTGASRDQTFTRTHPETGRPIVKTGMVHVLGFSGELKVLKDDTTDLKVYATFHHFLDAGEGVTAGLLGRFNVGDDLIHAFRMRVEGRTFSAGFQPAYFNTLYEITKYQSLQRPSPEACMEAGGANHPSCHQISGTRHQQVFGDEANGFFLDDPDARRFGYHLDFSWALFSGSRSNKKIAIGFGLEDSTASDDTNFYVHLEAPVVEYVQLFASFLRLNAAGIGGIFDSNLDNVVVLSGLRVKVLPVLFINAHYSRAFQIIRSAGKEFHLGNANVASSVFEADRVFEPVDTLLVELELGWEFDD